MNVFASYADKTAAALTKAQADADRIARDRQAHELSRPDGSDLDALIDWRRKSADFMLREEAAEEALAFARSAAAKQAKAAAVAEQDRLHTQARRTATAHAKLIVEIAADAEKLADKLAKAEQMRADVAAANAARGERPLIVDGESKLRKRAGTFHPGRTVEDEVSLDEHGNTVKHSIWDRRSGKWIKNPAAVRRAKVTTVLEAPMQLPDEPLPPLAKEIRLVDMAGEVLWPR